ncbi:MAG: SET domain-containing protein [Chlorobiaceae bacterium]
MEANLFLIIALSLAASMLLGIMIGRAFKKQASGWRRGKIAIGASTVSGRGVFATERIKDGTIIERCPAIEVGEKDIDGELVNYVFYGSTETKRLVVMGYGMLFNHSSSPNVAYYREESPIGAELILYALRDIKKGEELFYHYGDEWWNTRQ